MPLLLLSMFLGVGIAVYSAAGRWRQLGWHLGMVSGLLPEDYHAPDMSTDIANFCLKNTIDIYEYMKLGLDIIPEEIIQQ